MKVLAVLVLTIVLGSCSRPGDHPVSPNCLWTEDDNRTLNLENFADRRHLTNDAVTAEDMAIRWADQHFHLRPEWDARCYECVQSLFKGVASHHGVDVNLVRQYSRQRDVVADSVTILSFGLLYLAAVYYLIGKIRRRFSADESINFWIMTAVISVGAGLVGLLVGGLWSIVIETYRLNSAHLSYRMNLIPFRQHWFGFLLCGVLAFWLMALIRSKDVPTGLKN
jgi:hypothetical protein